MTQSTRTVIYLIVLVVLLSFTVNALTVQELIDSYNYDYNNETLSITTFNDYMTDTNANSINDTLVFDLTTDVLASVQYYFIVRLEDGKNLVQNYSNSVVNPGSPIAQVKINTESLTESQFNYSVEVRDQSFALIFAKYNIQTNNYQNYEQGIALNSITDQNINNDVIRLTLNLNVNRNQDSNITIYMTHNETPLTLTKEFSLTSPSQNVMFDIDNETIKSTHHNGVFIIHGVQVGSKLLEANHTTSTYNYEDFAETSYIKDITSGVYDNNQNNLSDGLMFNVSVHAKTQKNYTLELGIYDTSENYITTLRTSEVLSLGETTLIINWTGEKIYSFYKNGEFLVSHVRLIADNQTEDVRYSPHTTESYIYSQFERPPLPDLVPVITTTFQNNVTNVTINVTNAGTNTAFNILIDFFDNGTYENQFPVYSINASETITRTFTALNTSNNSRFYVIADFYNYVDESDETNNIDDNSLGPEAYLIPSTAYTTDNITVQYSNAINPEINWYVNGSLVLQNQTMLIFTYFRKHDNVSVEVIDNSGSASDFVIIQNSIPSINQANISVNEGEAAQSIPTVIDNDGDIVTLSYSPLMNNSGTWITSYEDSGTFLINVTASDGESSASDEFSVIVYNTNRPPTINPIPNIIVNEAEFVSITPTSTDPDNQNNVSNDDNVLSYSYSAPLNSTGEWQTGYFDAGVYVVEVVVSDGSLTDSQNVTVTVNNVNRAPQIQSIPNITATETDIVQLTPNGTDPDGDPVTYTYTSPLNSTGEWTTGYNDEGTYTVNVTVSDGSLTDTITTSITVLNKNRAPQLDTISNITIDETQGVQINPTSTDLDGDAVSYIFESPLNSTGGWTTTYDDSEVHTVTVTATDGDLNDSQDVTITVNNVNRAPTLNPISNIIVNETDLAKIIPTATDPDNQNNATNDDNVLTYTYSAPFNASGEWRTDYDDAGTYTIQVTVSDGSLADSQNVTITVNNVNRAPLLQSIPNMMVNEDDMVSIIPNGTDPDGDPVSYAFTPPLNSTGEWRPTYEDSGSYVVEVSATDGSLTGEQNVTITINNVNRAPVLGVISNVAVDETDLIAIMPNATDPDNQNNVSNDDNVISYIYSTPLNSSGEWHTTYDDSGIYFTTVTVTDGSLTDSQNVTLVVFNVNRAPIINSFSPASTITTDEGTSLTFIVNATDPDGDNISYEWEYDGVVEGNSATFTKGFDYYSNGTHTVTLTVYDYGLNNSNTWNVTVLNAYNMTGNSSTIQTNLDNLTIIITQNGTERIGFYENGSVRIEFNYNLSLNLDLTNVSIEEQNGSTGSILITGINLTSQGQTKTVYVDNLQNSTGVCIWDQDYANITEMSIVCTDPGEIWIACPGSVVPYSCEDNPPYLVVSGLSHSAVREQDNTCGDNICRYTESCSTCATDCGECPSDNPSPGGGGPGGGRCKPVLECGAWSECTNGAKTRICKDIKCGTDNTVQTDQCTPPSTEKDKTTQTDLTELKKAESPLYKLNTFIEQEQKTKPSILKKIAQQTWNWLYPKDKEVKPLIGMIITLFTILLGAPLIWMVCKKTYGN